MFYLRSKRCKCIRMELINTECAFNCVYKYVTYWRVWMGLPASIIRWNRDLIAPSLCTICISLLILINFGLWCDKSCALLCKSCKGTFRLNMDVHRRFPSVPTKNAVHGKSHLILVIFAMCVHTEDVMSRHITAINQRKFNFCAWCTFSVRRYGNMHFYGLLSQSSVMFAV